jgi:hypothetical protein
MSGFSEGQVTAEETSGIVTDSGSIWFDPVLNKYRGIITGSAQNFQMEGDAGSPTNNTLDQAYDQGGKGAGAIITIDNQPVQFQISGPTTTALAITGSALFGDTSSEFAGHLPPLPGTDVTFFVSGSSGSKDIAGVSVFGGDTVVSGTLYVLSSEMVVGELDGNAQLTIRGSAANEGGAANSASFTIDSFGNLQISAEAGEQITFPNAIDIQSSARLKYSVPLKVGNNSEYTIGLHTVDSALRIVKGSSLDNNVKFFASSDGYIGINTTDVHEQFVVNGNVVVSGTCVFASTSSEFGGHIPSSPGTDVSFFVSGSTAKGVRVLSGVSCFSGDIVVSGTIYNGNSANINSVYDTDTITTNTTLGAMDRVIFVDATSDHVTASLPPAPPVAGKVYDIKKIDSSGNDVVILANGGDTIDGDGSKTISVQYTSITIVSNGMTGWNII